MDLFIKNRNTIICVLVVLVAASILFVLYRYKNEHFESDYFSDPSDDKNRISLSYRLAIGIAITLVIGTGILCGVLMMRKNKDSVLPEITESESF